MEEIPILSWKSKKYHPPNAAILPEIAGVMKEFFHIFVGLLVGSWRGLYFMTYCE